MPEILWTSDAVLGFVMASKGYPVSYKKGFEIKVPDALDPAVKVYHMGTSLKKAYGSLETPMLVTSGGRVLMVVAKGKDLKAAREKALEAVRQIDCPNLFYRADIGHWAL
jgi:phosphoribosylamine--glycine ligase